MSKKVSCFKCRHLKITWDPSFPYACNAIGFKSKMIPSAEVRRTSGEDCRLFSPKDPKRSKE